MLITFIAKSSFWAQVFLINLTTLIMVYLAEESIIRDSLSVPDAVYMVFATILIIAIIPCLVYLYLFINNTPKGVLVDNRILWLSVIVIGLAYISGISTSGNLEGVVLDIVAVTTFYVTGIRLLQMNEDGLGQEQKLQSAINNFFRIFIISIGLAVAILLVSYSIFS